VQLYLKNQIFWNTIFRLLGVLHSEMFTRAIECPSLLAYTPLRMGAPSTIFFQSRVKNWLIIQRISACNFGFTGSNSMKLCHRTGHKGNIVTYIQHLEDTAPLKFGKAKNI